MACAFSREAAFYIETRNPSPVRCSTGKETTMADPFTPADLKSLCLAWPSDVVRSAVVTALRDVSPNRVEAEALSSLIAIWLTEPELTEPPPLAPAYVKRIWKQLTAMVQ